VTRKPGSRPDESDRFLRTGGALEGSLWSEVSALLAARAGRPSSTVSDATADTCPATIGPYEVRGLLGSGGMGDVFLAFDPRLQRQVAIKRIRTGKPITENARGRLRREAAAAAALNHPAIVQVYDILDEPSGQAIVMEYAEGDTLARVLDEGPLPAATTVGVVRQVAEGLAAAHAVGLVHRDLKTQNVLVTPSGQAKVLDFGLARRFSPAENEDRLTAEGVVVGTPRAMSPEQAQGSPLDARSDLFSLGVLLYEVCTGRSPFEGDTRLQTLHKVVTEPPPPVGELNPGLPQPLIDLIEELLQKDPALRPPSAAAVADRLGRIERLPALEGLRLPGLVHARDAPGLAPAPDAPGLVPAPEPPVQAAPPKAGPPGDRRARTSRRRPLAVVLGLVLAAAAVTTTHTRRVPAPARLLAVLVQEPTMTAPDGDDDRRFAAFAVRESALRALLELRGIEAIGPEELAETGVPARDAPRATAADELLAATLTCGAHWCRVSLRRQRPGDGRLVGSTGSFEVSSTPEDALDLANAVALHVRAVYPDHPARSSGLHLEVRGADYEQYLRLRRRTEGGDVLGPAEIDVLERISRSSPGLAEAAVLAADAARLLPDHARAERILESAVVLHPGDPRILYALLQLRIEAGETEDAERLLADLERLAPGDIRVWRARARLLGRQGKPGDVADVRRRMVRERPSWKNLWYLADVEIELGNAAAARLHLHHLLELSGGNALGLEKMAELEWELGDPRAAARLYEELLSRKVDRMYLSNLGWSLLLAGDYPGAVASCRRALQLDPHHALTRLNLGIAHEGTGDEDAARALYEDLAERLGKREPSSGSKSAEAFVIAQALARLGSCVPAVSVATRALAAADPTAQTSFRAAVVHALCGERNHAVVYAREARQRGLSRWWFGIPGLEALRAAPELAQLLTEPQAPPSVAHTTPPS
jgi:serine/threonine-protein kinase